MNTTARTWYLLRVALGISGIFILFFSGILPVREYLALVPSSQLTAAVVPADVASLTNQNRIQNGLPPLTVNPLLTQAAQLKANDMAQNSYYSHTSPDGKSPLYWLDRSGYKYLNAGENLVIDRTTSEQAVAAWMDSPDHRENILRPQFTEFGIGVALGQYQGVDTIFVVQEFGTPYPLNVQLVHASAAPTNTAPIAVAAPVTSAPTATTPTRSAILATSSVAGQDSPSSSLGTQALTSTAIVNNVKALVTPLVRSITPHDITPPKRQPTSLATSTPPVFATTTASSTTTTASSDTPTATSSFSYALAPEFFTPVFANLHEQIATARTGTIPATQDPTPNWIRTIRAYILRITNFVPRIW